MRVLVTGNLGYVGPVVCRYLRKNVSGVELIGIDSGYFSQYRAAPPRADEEPDIQIDGDIRETSPDVFHRVDAVVHLAAISNDPMGNRFEAVTQQVNRDATVGLARIARDAGVSRFVFASSCSVYGVDDGTSKSEQSRVQPLTAYAKSKVDAEEGLRSLATTDFTVTSLRFATACGFSPRCRLDLVLNDFVASALTRGEIVLLSDGSPWRPLVHVEDMARAIHWAVERTDSPSFEAINAGSREWNFQIGDLARAVGKVFDVPVRMNQGAGPDKRSYRVDFSHFERLAPGHQPLWNLEKTVGQLRDGLSTSLRTGMEFRNAHWIRLSALSELIESGRLDDGLRWLNAASGEQSFDFETDHPNIILSET